MLYIAGSYCPDGTEYSTQYQCPMGTYNNNTMADNIYDCKSCTGENNVFPILLVCSFF